jgi:hypothetical protein
MATSEEEFHAQCLQRFLDLANTINGEGIDTRIVSSGLMTASAIYSTYTLAGNEGSLTDKGTEKLAEAYKDQVDQVQRAKRARQQKNQSTVSEVPGE